MDSARRYLRHAAAAAVTLALGVALGNRLGGAEPAPPAFHQMRVNHPRDYSALVTPEAPAVADLARRLGSLEAAYGFVRDEIAFEPMRATGPPEETLAAGRASCLGKAALLASLYRALGVPSAGVRVVVGQIPAPDGLVEHAWIDMEYGDRCLQQDATDLLGVHEFAAFPGQRFVDVFVSRELFCFNDEGFAAVSQLNRMRR
ncbi:MAG TPA: transglutaminase-like domain-containing protein [bacterium]